MNIKEIKAKIKKTVIADIYYALRNLKDICRVKLYFTPIHLYYDTKRSFLKNYTSQINKTRIGGVGGYNVIHSKKIIYVADDIQYAGGLADRFRAMVSLFSISKKLNVDYKIYMTSPVNLTDYLLPNQYNWIISDDEIIYDVKESVKCYFSWRDFKNNDTGKHLALVTIQSLLKRWNQLHITSNMVIADEEYGKLFNELFMPADELKNNIEKVLSEIGRDFISVSFRFQQLLGDFIDPGFPVLPVEKQVGLINRCIEHLYEIYKENNCARILVTSDSITFLNKAKEFDFVYVIPGEIAHIAYEPGLGKEVYMKIFLDYFMLTRSKCLYQVVDDKMYVGGFARRAALHNNHPYIVRRYGL